MVRDLTTAQTLGHCRSVYCFSVIYGSNIAYFQVDVTWFYMNCLVDTCSCSRGGDCECFCTSVAAYAQRCCHQGVPVDWRSPSLCRKSLLFSLHPKVITVSISIAPADFKYLFIWFVLIYSALFLFFQHTIVNSTTKVRACPMN